MPVVLPHSIERNGTQPGVTHIIAAISDILRGKSKPLWAHLLALSHQSSVRVTPVYFDMMAEEVVIGDEEQRAAVL